MKSESKKYTDHLMLIPKSEWPNSQQPNLVDAWRSRDYLVQIFKEKSSLAPFRMSVNRIGIDGKGDWKQDIPWEDLQRMKNELGWGGFDAVEVYPARQDTVNVANMRHLWIMADPLEFAWRKS